MEKLRQLEDKVQGLGGEALAIDTDITKEDQVDRMVSENPESVREDRHFSEQCRDIASLPCRGDESEALA